MVADERAVGCEDAPRRRIVSGLLSLVVHASLVAIAIAAFGRTASPRAPAVDLTEVEVVAPPVAAQPPRPAGHGPVARTSAGAPAGVPGRHSRDGAVRSQTRAPESPFAELAIRMDTRTDETTGAEAPSGAGRGLAALGTGLGAGGTGTGFGDGAGGLGVPSLARDPRPRRDYRHWQFRVDRRFSGSVVLVELAIDPRGRVRAVRVVKGVTAAIDEHAVETARHFEFFPALDAGGEPIWSRYRWEFLVASDDAPAQPVTP